LTDGRTDGHDRSHNLIISHTFPTTGKITMPAEGSSSRQAAPVPNAGRAVVPEYMVTYTSYLLLHLFVRLSVCTQRVAWLQASWAHGCTGTNVINLDVVRSVQTTDSRPPPSILRSADYVRGQKIYVCFRTFVCGYQNSSNNKRIDMHGLTFTLLG